MTPSGPPTPRRSPLGAVAAFCSRRPWAVVAASFVVLLLAFGSLQRLRISGSLEAMLGTHSAAARAFHTVITEFHASEALLVLVEPQRVNAGKPATAEETAKTAAFADALVARLLTDERSKRLIAWARSRQDPAILEFATSSILPNGPFYLGESGTRELLARFEPQRLAEQFARNEALISSPGPAGDALSRNVLKDPLRLFELANDAGLSGMGDAAPAAPGTSPPPERSLDGHAVLVRVASKASVSDLDEVQALVRLVTKIAGELNSSGIEGQAPRAYVVRLGGAFAIASAASGTIRSDAIVSTLLSIGLLYGWFVIFYRRWLTPLLIGVVAGVGLIVGFGVHALAAPTVSPLAATVAALLAGLGVDYGIHFVSHFDSLRAQGHSAERCAAETAREMAVPITTNCFTSIFGFASLWPSKIAMLSDFAQLGAAGLIGAWIATFTLLPSLLVLTHRGKEQTAAAPSRCGLVADIIAKRPRLWTSSALCLLAIVVIAAASRGEGPKLEGDLTVLHPRPNEALRTTDEIITRFAGQGEMIPVLVSVKDTTQLLPTAIDTAKALTSEACRKVGVTDVIGVHRLLPDPRLMNAVRELLAPVDVSSLLSRFDAAVEASAFESSTYAGYREFLGRLLTAAHPPSITELASYPSISHRILPVAHSPGSPPTQTLLVVQLANPLREREQRAESIATLRKALSPIPQATLAGLAAVSEDLEDATMDGLPQSIAISVTLVLLWLVVVFRRPKDVIKALIPLLFGGLFTVAFMVATATRFNPINSIAIPLLSGIAVDAGVFFVSAARQAGRDGVSRTELVQRLQPTMRAVLLAVATTITGFASLCVTHTPAIRSLGFLAAVGIAASLCGMLGILVPWMLKDAGNGSQQSKRPS